MRHVPSLAGDVEELVGYVYTEVGWDYYAQVPPSPPPPLSSLCSREGAAGPCVSDRVRPGGSGALACFPGPYVNWGRALGQRRVGGAAPWEMAVRESRAGSCQPLVGVQLMCATTVTS